MEHLASRVWEDEAIAGTTEMRAAPRFTLLIRAARLVTPKGEFVCVIRDASETGVSVRLFHAMPDCSEIELHMPGGESYEIRPVWARGNEAGFEFARPIEVARLINEAGEYPKRGLRLGVGFPVDIFTLTQSCTAQIENFSQQGARIVCDFPLAIDQSLRIVSSFDAKDVRAKVRWRRGSHYGVVFDDTFTLGDFARFAAKLQAPELLDD